MRTLFGRWDVVSQKYYIDGEWRPQDMQGMCEVEFSARWEDTVEIGGIVYRAEFIFGSRTVILHNPDDTVRIELKKLIPIQKTHHS